MGKRSKREADALASQALQYLKDGYTTSDVAEMLGVSVRTVQRWVSADPNLKTPSTEIIKPQIVSKKINSESDTFPKSSSVDNRLSLKTLIKTVLQNAEDGRKLYDLIDKTLQHHYTIHTEIAEDLYLKLKEELQKPEASFRNINFLSLALCRHCDYVHKNLFMGSERLIDVNKAVSILGHFGYGVIDKNTLSESLIEPQP